MQPSQLSLKWLEAFLLIARHGSIQTAAREMGLSVSTVSYHLSCLEGALGIDLIDHGKRPLTLTAKGNVMQPYVETALKLLDRAQVEMTSSHLHETRSLRLGLIEDFDSDIAPLLTRHLIGSLPKCGFSLYSRPSHEILELIGKGAIDIGVATQPVHDVRGLLEYPLLRDPFLIAVPAGTDLPAEDFLEGRSELAFLRYSRRQLIGARIDTQLRRMRLALPDRHEFESTQSLLGMVADGAGWAITTPLNHARARRFHPQLRLMPFPGRGFARYISLYMTETYSSGVAQLVQTTLRQLIQTRAIDPLVEATPWLREGFHLLDAAEVSPG